jgi:transposase-like protein
MAGRPHRKAMVETINQMGGMEVIAAAIADGSNLNAIAKRLKVGRSTLAAWIAADPERTATISRAREEASNRMADEVIDIADCATNESERVARLRIDARKWLASRWNPGIYGERTGPLVQIDLAGAHLRAVRPVDQPAPQVITIDIPSNDS